MEIIFDQSLVEAHRPARLRQADEKAGFLLDIVAQELAERVSVVERQFETAMSCTAIRVPPRAAFHDGKVGAIERVETDSAFGSADEPVTEAPLERIRPTRRRSVSRVATVAPSYQCIRPASSSRRAAC